VLRIRDVYSESRIRIYSIPDPNFFHPGSRTRIKEIKYFNPKKWFLSTQKYDPCCLSRIRLPDPDPDFLHIPDPGSRGQKGTGSRIQDPDPQHCIINQQQIESGNMTIYDVNSTKLPLWLVKGFCISKSISESWRPQRNNCALQQCWSGRQS
jgi:hypothetical protein